MIPLDFFNIQTPALLFPTISLLMLAYTNRFLGISSVIRKLHADMSEDEKNYDFYFPQIKSLNKRINLIVLAQKMGALSLICCVLSMITIFFNSIISIVIFGGALTFLSLSLILIFRELSISEEALNYILHDCEKINKKRKS